jgi:uncharacterized repeat protein (TIGR01451 family)
LLKLATGRWLGRSVAMLATLVTAASVLSLGSVANAATSVPLTKDVTVAAPPSSTFSSATSGDGWDVQFYGARIYNVFHHNSGAYQIDCHEQSDGSHCADGAAWPKTITDGGGGGYGTPGHSTGWVDTTTGDFYGWTTRASDNTGGVICVDLASTDANPFCGFTPLTGAGAAAMPMGSGVDGGALVGGKMYAVNAAGSGSPLDGALLCFDTQTKAPCDGQPFKQPDLSAIGSSVFDWAAVADGKVFTSTDSGKLDCFDPASGSVCSGSWPVLAPNSQAKPFPMLDASGSHVGVCIPQPNVVPCWNFDGSQAVTPAALQSAIANGGSWESTTTIATRVLVAGGNSVVYCYDFATGSQCANFPKSMVGSSLLYTVNPDPNRYGCIWTNADGGTSQIQNFDAFTGESGCSGTTRVAATVLIPNAACAALSWSSMQIVDPAPAGYTSATVDVTDNSGNAIASGLAVDGSGSVDLSALDPGVMPIFGISFDTPTFSASGIELRFTWESPDDIACTADAPGAPTAATAGPTGDREVPVSWTPPASDGGAPITRYTVTAAPGGASCTAAATDTSCTVTGLTNASTYAFRVTATNAAGTSAPSSPTTATTLAAGEPDPPAAPSVTPGSETVDVSWLPPADGGSPITGYTVTAAPDGATCTATPPATSCAVPGLTNGTGYTFTVTATNANGTSVSSNISREATPGDPPSKPAAPTATAGNGAATVSWTAPDPGTSPILSYRVVAAPGGAVCVATAPATSCTVSGLTNGMAYTFTVTASNASGTSAASDASGSVTPAATSADLAISMSAPSSVYINSTVTYAITVSNNGPDAANAVVVTDVLPVSGRDFTTTSAGCVIATSTLTCNVATLASSASATFKVSVVATGDLSNVASVTSSTNDPDVANNTSSTVKTNATARPTLPTPPADSTDSQSKESTDASGTVTATTGPLTVGGKGPGGLTIATLGGSPSGTPARDETPALNGPSFGGFYNVQLELGSGFTSTTLRLHGTPSSSLFWWDGTSWQKVPGVTRDSKTGDLSVTIDATTTPSIGDLSNANLAGGATPVTRLGGADRTETAVMVSHADYPARGSASAVVIARDDVFADALTGGPLAAAKNGPVLLTGSTILSTSVRDEIRRVLPAGGTVYLLGNSAAISDGVSGAISALGFKVQRIGGADRYATAVAIANALGNPSTVFEASGVSFADALSAGPAAIANHGAVLLTGNGIQAGATSSYLAAHTGAARFAVGGHAGSADGKATALVGADRYATAALVAAKFFTKPSVTGVATGENFADSMVAVPSLGKRNAPLLLVPSDGAMPSSVASYLQAHSATITSATTFGGVKAVSDNVLKQVQQATP